MRKSIHSTSSLQTKSIAKALAKTLLESQQKKGATVVALAGELGSGKTTFTQGFAKGLGVTQRILSPTFILLKEFRVKHPFFRTFYHIDCYRLDNPAKELLHVGLKKIITDPHNIVVVEWADRIKKILPKDVLWLRFFHRGPNQRTITVWSKAG
jgi:tRNA threonylcarbamoyladenosine biosynthesis protein TsaE